jgi:hypothetical protein
LTKNCIWRKHANTIEQQYQPPSVGTEEKQPAVSNAIVCSYCGREGHSRRTHHNCAANPQSSIYDLNDAERTSTFYNFTRQNRNEDVTLRQDIVNMEANSNSMCDIKPRGGTTSLIRRAKRIVWDESSMTSKSIFETVDRSIRDILKDEDSAFGNTPFGGRLFVFSGDFRQVLPVYLERVDHKLYKNV